MNYEKSIKLSEALLSDFQNIQIFSAIENSKNNNWIKTNSLWSKILSNQMHAGSNQKTLNKRQKLQEFELANNLEEFIRLEENDIKELLARLVPGGRFISNKVKVENLIKIISILKSKQKNCIINENSKKEEILHFLLNLPGVGSKQARNIPMDLYHPSFRNGTIPIDENWKKIAKYLETKWTNSDTHEQEIIDWKNQFIFPTIQIDDWDFDRLVYFSLNTKGSDTHRLIRQ